MRKYVFISIGGILGAILRYLIEGVHISHYNKSMPLNTLIINVAGSFILSLFLTIAFEVREFDANIRLGIAIGLLGAFTTFSTLCKETVGLLHEGDYFSAISYITVSTMIGLAAVYFGIVLAREVVSKLFKNNKGELKEAAAEIIEGGVE